MRQELLILLLADKPPRQEDTFWKRGAAVVVCSRRMPRDSSLHGAEVRNFLLTLSGFFSTIPISIFYLFLSSCVVPCFDDFRWNLDLRGLFETNCW